MRLIPLTQGYFAKVDDHWFDFLNQWNWYYHKGYAIRNSKKGEFEKRKTIWMHLVIHPSPEGFETDHWDTDTLNNQEENLRIVTHQQNLMNKKSKKDSSSKYKGVSWHKRSKKWQSQIKTNNHNKHLGYFDLEIDAAEAYDKDALELFGEYAFLNEVSV